MFPAGTRLRYYMVAVGMPVTRTPAQIPACGTPAPGSCLGSTCRHPKACRTPSCACGRIPRLCVRLRFTPPGSPWPAPSLHRSASPGAPDLCEGFLGPLEAVRLPAPVHHGRPQRFTVRTGQVCQARCRASRVPLTVFPVHARGLRPRRVRLRLTITASTMLPSACSERVGTQTSPISGLNTLPVHSPVNASCLPLPLHPHDSGPVWLARPSLSGTCTLHHCAGLSRR